MSDGGTSNSLPRRLGDPDFADRFFVGDAIDIGAGPDSLWKQRAHWPKLRFVRDWDREHGDAQLMAGVAPASFDLVYSSHCLEHMVDARAAFARWWELVRPGGFLVVAVPDEDLYEQGRWPSTFNADHKHTFRWGGDSSWSPVSVDCLALAHSLNGGRVRPVGQITDGYDFNAPRQDQTATRGAEASIEIIVERLP